MIRLLAIGIVACNVGENGGDRAAITNSGDVHVIENAECLWTECTSWQIDAQPISTIVDTDSSPHHFFAVTHAKRLQNGDLVLASRGTTELLVFDSLGSLRSVIGRRGSGPEEFSGIYGLYRCAGATLIVTEDSRVSVIAPQGDIMRKINMADLGGIHPPEIKGVTPDCSEFLVLDREPLLPPYPSQGIYRGSRMLYWVSRGGNARDTVARFEGSDRTTVDFLGGAPQIVPWGRAPVWATFDGRVYLGRSEQFEIEVFDRRENRLTAIIRWSGDRKPITANDRRMFADKRERLLTTVPYEQADWFAPLDRYPIPADKPAYARFLVDDEGNLWVQSYPISAAGWSTVFDPDPRDPPDEWWVFEASGRLLGTVTMPAGLHVLSIHGDHIVGIRRDELDVESIQLYRIRRRR